MLHLYYKPTCPYCQRVLQANEQIGAKLHLLDVSASDDLREELVAKGGKKQVPFLVDDEKKTMLYESGDIIEYLRVHYGKGGVVDAPQAVNVCPID